MWKYYAIGSTSAGIHGVRGTASLLGTIQNSNDTLALPPGSNGIHAVFPMEPWTLVVCRCLLLPAAITTIDEV
jgi:hypothetical protein